MKLTQLLHLYKTQYLSKLINNEVNLTHVKSFTIIALIAGAIYFIAPYITWGDYAPLAQAEKRIYVIIFLFLAWLLKILILDMESSNSLQNKDANTLNKILALQSRFQGAVAFLKKTTLSKSNQSARLNQLPWYLLIGPANVGKTSLLANSKINFILQKQFQDPMNISPSEHCDWWVTRDVCILDVPSHYLATRAPNKNTGNTESNTTNLWRPLLELITKQRGKNGINGILIAMPLPELMKQKDPKHYHAMLRQLFQNLNALQKHITHPIPCHLVITKCDLLAGFAEFFAESSNDEISQAWGITLPAIKKDDKIDDLFAQRFNALIKKLNQQLLWRLHHERNPLARPYIKDFPLQVERMKEFALDFIKKFHGANFNLALQSIHLTSALQTKPDAENKIIDDVLNNTQRALQIFKEPSTISRAYFIKQFITQGLGNHHADNTNTNNNNLWARRSAYAASISIVALAAFTLGKDFQNGIKQTYALQNSIANYSVSAQQIQDPDERLLKTLQLLDLLKEGATSDSFKLDISHLLSFYSTKSQQNAVIAYKQALQTILLPEVKSYFEDYLRLPINRNTEFVYATLKSYIMLGDTAHYQVDYISNTLQEILPKAITDAESKQLLEHIHAAFSQNRAPIVLDTNLIQNTRKYFSMMPGQQLGYIILKNINSNNSLSDINMGTNSSTTPIFTSRVVENQIPHMFTVKSFANIISHESTIAAEEATHGNWVLGNEFSVNKDPMATPALIQQLRSTYVNNYIETWERLLANVNLSTPSDLSQADAMIVSLISSDSPLLQLLQTLHENTYFEPIASSSPKLQDLGMLLEKNSASNQLLYQIFSNLQTLHQFLQTILTTENEKKAAFEAVSNRMQHNGAPDILTQLRIIAEKSPEPVKGWLDKLTNDVWRQLIKDAGHYLDISWQEQVGQVYQTEIANRYPFSTKTDKEVDLQTFSHFFGNPGIVMNFYNQYLSRLVDTSHGEWRWKKLNNDKLPISDESLRQIQHAIRIHKTFFPNGDNKLNMQFGLQPYQFDTNIKNVKLTINNKQIIDEKAGPQSPHMFTWPSKSKKTSVQLTMTNHEVVNRVFTGDWSWFKLVNQTFESAASHKQMLLNVSMNEQPAKYLLFTQDKANPFITLNLRHFRLPRQLTDEKS